MQNVRGIWNRVRNRRESRGSALPIVASGGNQSPPAGSQESPPAGSQEFPPPGGNQSPPPAADPETPPHAENPAARAPDATVITITVVSNGNYIPVVQPAPSSTIPRRWLNLPPSSTIPRQRHVCSLLLRGAPL